jgi:hypothetical protein
MSFPGGFFFPPDFFEGYAISASQRAECRYSGVKCFKLTFFGGGEDMRKFALSVVAVVMLLTFVGCGDSTPPAAPKPTTTAKGT